MEAELKRILTEMKDENAAAFAQMREQNATAHRETREYVDRSLNQMREENAAAHAETRALLRDKVDYMTDSFDDKLQLIGEGVIATNERLDRLEIKFDRIAVDHDARLTRLEAASFRSKR